jgi:hypothetical protein
VIALLAIACADPDRACDAECADLAERVEECGGFGESAWRDAEDFDSWCGAWSLARRALARDAGAELDCGPVPSSLGCDDLASGAWATAADGNE